MGFSRVAALHLLPLLVRVTLCAVFVPAGWSKIMNQAEFSGPAAATIRTLTGVSTADAKPAALGQELSPPSEAARAESEAAGWKLELRAERPYTLIGVLGARYDYYTSQKPRGQACKLHKAGNKGGCRDGG